MSKNSSSPVALPSRRFEVEGMDCPSCAQGIQRALCTVPGIGPVEVDVLQGTVRVGPSETRASDALISAAIRRAGYGVRSDRTGTAPASRGRLAAALVGGVSLGIGLVWSWTAGASPLATGFLMMAVVASSWYVVPRALGALRQRRLDIHVLMVVAATGAGAIGEWGEAGAAMFLFGVAQWIEGLAVGRARGAITALMRLAPTEAIRRRHGVDETVPVDQVVVGDEILIRPGDRAPLDGIVRAGGSAMDQSPITGESIPVEKGPGDPIYAGAINGAGSLTVEVTHRAPDTTLARVLHAVEEAENRRAPSQGFVDRFARVYTPIVVVLAVLVAVFPPLLLDGGVAPALLWHTWLERGLTLLVVACPCALVIATPVTLTSGMAGLARGGVLVKGGAALERLAAITTVAFDKTGTLTEGVLDVTDVLPVPGTTAEELLRVAAGIERHSEHPVAKAIVRRAHALGIPIPEPESFEALPGRGAKGCIDGRVLFAGNTRICAELDACDPTIHQWIAELEATGKTGVLVSTAERPVGVIALADRVRPDARQAIASLRRAGVQRVVMLTGDNAPVAAAVAEAVAIAPDDIKAALLPVDKRDAVLALQQQGGPVAVVGDGINDAPALATADLGIAMGIAGTPAALETAGAALMGHELAPLPWAFRHARRTRVLLRENVALALGLKFLFLLLAGGGVATLWMAVAADTGASVLVVLNGLRALRA